MKRVLLVDDNQAVTRSIRATLTRSTNYAIRTVNDSRNAHAAALEFEPHVIVMDIDMPHKDGPSVAEDLRTDMRTRAIPIVFLSAICAQDDQVLSPGQTGRDLMIAKPFQLKTFLSVLRELLQPAGYPAGMLMAR